ncbi:50S ribosomal protein L17 [Ureaplasma zalophigenitalium]|uniref:50S ribosomal protein L17 n=1 Tax=Ureaplasma zalophigenitalium TaxID=907723 RepID=A0ABT3BNS6_9BACT|nr:50S ribosomal protein L17 [Ureaplasma zalophigenitalium]MCV3753900.1 50S ribosomal protein L17 [Ureaplasma zalophigenitalium]
MSYINKPGKTRSWRKMVTRQQVSDVISHGSIVTTKTKAKETQRHVDHIITLAKKNTLASRRAAAAILLRTNEHTVDELLAKLFNELNHKYKDRNGGYTRVVKLGSRLSDNTEEAVLALV